jgi:hypothetical protein
MAMLTFGLTKYYSNYNYKSNQIHDNINGTKFSNSNQSVNKDGSHYSALIFAIIYAIVLGIGAVVNNPNSEIYSNWNHINWLDITALVAAILVTFFMPGYAIILILSQKSRIGIVPKLLFAYLLSMLLSGILGYVFALYFDISISEAKGPIIAIYAAILIAFIIFHLFNQIKIGLKSRYQTDIKSIKFLNLVKNKSSELLVFGSLFMILVIYGYYLFGGVTIGDQWFHQGRALLFISGSIKEAALIGADEWYPPFQSSILAVLTALSGLPLVNAYASIAFLNITPVFAFYYFFSTWIPYYLQRAKLLASTLFAISSGFGWAYLLGITTTSNPIVSAKSALDTIVSTEPFDVFQPTNFFPTAHPEFSTALIYIALPAGFFLLALLKENLSRKSTFIFMVTAISILGILAHDEFYLFIIIASVLPLLFKIKKANYMYLSFLIAIFFVYVADLVSPQSYYTSHEIISGISLLLLNALFVGLMWTIHTIKQNVLRALQSILIPWKKSRSRYKIASESKQSTRLRFITGVIVISAVSYVYGLSFIVLSHLSTEQVIIQTAGYGGPYNIPWYLYSLKLGVTGLLGLAYILSYIFKKFEREIFVFGVIGLIALLAGPYYDEHRFSKYIMAGMAGFASLLILKLVSYLNYNRPLVSRIIIGVIITTGTLSSILFIGYNSLILQTQDFVHTLGRRNFPASEIPLFQILHEKMDIDSKRYNVLTFAKEYNNFDDGLMAAVQGFSGLPFNMIYQNPLTLNVSNLDSFYHLLVDSGIKYIIIPKETVSKKSELKEPIIFALDHFGLTYQDKKYIVLEVPSLGPVSQTLDTNTALIYDHNKKQGKLPPHAFGLRYLQYNDTTFNFGGETNFVVVQQGNKTEKIVLSDYDSSRGITIWSKDIDSKEGINYVEANFRTINENINRSNDVGLRWTEEDGKQYYLSLSQEGLSLFEKTRSSDNNYNTKLVYENVQIGEKLITSYNLKLAKFQNSINVFLNDILAISMSTNNASNKDVGFSQIGLSSSNSVVEFAPIKIGHVSSQIFEDRKLNSDYYYPLSVVALSENDYDILTDKDLSALSKKQLLLTFDPTDWEDTTFNQYLTYARNGGKIIVMNSDFVKGKFGNLISLRSHENNTAEFETIIGSNNQSINISGTANRVEIKPSSNVTVISTYRDKANKTVAPFLIEKSFPNGGKILLANTEGYFNALSKNPRSNFQSLSNISTMLGLHRSNTTFFSDISKSITAQAQRFIGNLDLHGNMTLKTSSLLLPELEDLANPVKAERVLIVDKKNHETHVLNNLTLYKLELIGPYDITVSSNGTSNLPNKYSEHEYISMSIPARFNITLNPLNDQPNSSKIVTLNGSTFQTIGLNNVSVTFYNISHFSTLKPVTILVKSPDVKASGHIGFKSSNFDRYFTNEAIPLDVQGQLEAKFDFVDDFEQDFGNGTTKMQYITYLQSISLNSTERDNGIRLEFPGDVSAVARNVGPQIPLKESLLSVSSLLLLISIAIISLILGRLIWPKIKPRVSNENV